MAPRPGDPTSFGRRECVSGTVGRHLAAALPTHILSPGDYSVAADRGGKQYTQNFTVKAGEAMQVEVVANE